MALLTEAVIVHEHRGVADPDQAWILGELIAYLEHSKSGAMDAADMGPHWTSIREGAKAGTLTTRTDGIDDAVDRWDEFSRYLCLHLGRKLGKDVGQVLSRRDRGDPARRSARLVGELADQGLSSAPCGSHPWSLTSTSSPISGREVTASLDVAAPREGRRTRVNWLVRQLRSEASSTLRIDTYFESRSATTSQLLGALIENPDEALLSPRMPRGFRAHAIHGDAAKWRRAVIRRFGDGAARVRRIGSAGTQGWAPRAPRLPEQQHSAEPEAPAGGEATT